MAEDISDLASLESIDDLAYDLGDATVQTFDDYGLGDLDWLSGGALRQNAGDPYFDPSIYQRQETARDRAMQNAQRRKEFLEENPMEFEQIPAGDQAILGLGQGALDLTRGAAGLADAARIPGARDLGEWAGEEAGDLEFLTEGGSGLGSMFQVLGRAGMSVIPSIAAGILGGFAPAVAAGAAQSFGSVFEDAQDGYIQQGLSEGQARNRAYLPATAAALITGGVTAKFGRTGVEALTRGLTSKAITGMIRQPIFEILKGAGKEAAEEAIDELGQGVVAILSYNPDMTIADAVLQAIKAGGIGGVLGGLGETAAAGVRGVAGLRRGRQSQPDPAPAPAPEIDPLTGVREIIDQTGIGSAADEVIRGGQGAPGQVPVIEDDILADLNLEMLPEEQEVGLRRGKRERTPEALGARILTALGADEETAREFAAEFTKSNPPTGDLEQWRAGLLEAFNAAGLEPENTASMYRETAEDYEAMGFTAEQALEYARSAKTENEKVKTGLRARNRERLAGLRRGMKAEIAPEVRAELQVQEPTEDQKESGNYKKAHIQVGGLNIAIENVEGSVRRGTDKNGQPWEVEMPADYGYFKSTKGKDGDAVDVYVGPMRGDSDPSLPVFVVDQINPENGKFDEHKALLGFPDQASALAVYDAAFSDGSGPGRRGAVTAMPAVEFKAWLENGNTRKPVAYKRDPKQDVAALRAVEAGNQMPDGRPIDPRERIKWLMDDSKKLAKTDKETGWQRILEAGELRQRLIDGERSKVPSNAAAVRVDYEYLSSAILDNGGMRKASLIFTPSAKPQYAGQWQVTRVDERGPTGDAVYPSLEVALKQELDSPEMRVTDIRFKKGGGSSEVLPQEGLQVQQMPEEESVLTPEVGASQPAAPADLVRKTDDISDRIDPQVQAVEPEQQPVADNIPMRTVEEENELDQINRKKVKSTNDIRRMEVLEKKSPHVVKRKAREEWGDLIELVRAHGQIKGLKSAKPGTEGYYGAAYREIITRNSLKPLFTNKGGMTPDSMLGALIRYGYYPEDTTVEDMWADLLKAADNRIAVRTGTTKEDKLADKAAAKAEEFHALAVENQRPNKKDRKAAKPVAVNSLLIGDEFSIDGEPFEVSDMEFRDNDETGESDLVSIVVSDGRRFDVQRLGADQVIYPDKGKVKSDPNATEFLPPEDRQESIGGQDGTPSRGRAARGTPGIEQMLESANLPANTKRVWLSWLKTPVMQNLNWDALRVELWDYIQTGAQGSRLGRLIYLSEHADAQTFPHEMAHVLFDTLPLAEQEAIEAWRLDGLKKLGITDERMLSGTLTSKEFRFDVGHKLAETMGPDDAFALYRFINASEFYAHFIGEKFAQDAFANRNSPPSLWQKLRDIFQTAMDTLRRVIGFSPTQEQIYRETLQGTWKPDLDAIIKAEEEQASYSATARQAANARELARTQQEKEIEATHQLAQSVNIVEFLNKHGANVATFAAQKALGYLDYLGIRAVGVNLNNGTAETYRQLKARITDQFQRNWLARLAAVQVASFEGNLKQAIKDGQEAFTRISSTAFLKKLARRAALEQKTTNTKLLDETATAMLEAAHKQALKVLREEAKSDLEIAEAQGMVDEIEAAKNSSSAMSILMNDMITVLAASPEGVVALSDPNVTQQTLKDIYRDIKKSADQPLFNPNLMNWASYILARNAELRDALWAAQLARNSAIRAQMGPYEKKFLADLENDPLKTIRREMRAAKKRTSDFERARFAYLTINKEVMRELAELQSKLEAKETAENILADPDWKGFRKEVYDDAEVEGTQKPFVAYADKLLLLPSGRELNVDPEFLKGSKTFFNQMRAQYLAAVAELETWLLDPANAYDPNYGTHRRNLTELQAYFTSLDTLKPADSMMVFKTALTIVRDAVEQAGGRMKAGALKAINLWNRTKQRVGWWNDEASNKIMEARIASLKSHKLKWSEFGERDIVWANREWWNNVGNLLAYSNNRQQGGFKVGDKLPSGWTVTAEDMVDLRLQSDLGTQGFEIIKDDQITEDFLGKIGLYRKALKGTDKMVRRVFNDAMLEFGRMYTVARSEFQKAFRAGDQQAMALYEQQMIDQLNQNWDKIGFAFIWDRNPEFAQATVLEDAFNLIGERMIQNPGYIGNFNQLLDEIVSFTPNVTMDEVKQIVMVEWGRQINNWYQQAKDDTEGRMVLPVRGAQAKNAATRSRNNAMAPYAFYEYGFKDARSIATFAGGLHSRALDRVVAALLAIEEDLDGQIKRLADSPNKRQEMKRNAIARKNGDTYDNFKSLERRKAMITRVLRDLTTYDEDQDVDKVIGRTIGAQTGMLVGQVRATVRNFSTGPLYIGAQVNRILGSTRASFPRAFMYSWLEGVKLGGSVAFSGAKWMGKKLTYNIADMARAAVQISKGEFRGAYDSLAYGLADALGREAIMRVKSVKRLVDAGLLYIPDYEKERQNIVLGTFAYAGRIAPREMSIVEKIGQIPAMTLEQPLMFLRAFLPAMGDAAINSAMAATLESGIGRIEERLKELFLDWQQHNYRQFDFNNLQSELNVFSAKELFPDAADPEKAFLEFKKAWQEAGMEFDVLATKFIGELRTNKQAKFLTKPVLDNLISLSIDQVNRSSPAGSALALRGRGLIVNLLKPFMSWKARTIQLFNRLLSVPAQSSRSRTAQWLALSIFLLVPLLLFNALFVQTAAEEADRWVARILHNQEKSSRHPWERDGFKSQAIGWTLNATLGFPGLDVAMNTALNDMPVRASLKADIAMLEKWKDVARYLGGAVMTGDPFFKLPETIISIAPEAKVVLNKLESESGKRESSNVIAVMRRHGDTELLRPTGGDFGVNFNELSPYGPKLENAAMNGDLEEFRNTFKEAVQVAKENGRPDPEKVVRQLFSHRNPWDRTFKAKLTEGQRKAFMAKLSEGEREMIADMERKFQKAANLAGASFNVTKEDPSALAPGRTGSRSFTSPGGSNGRAGGLRRDSSRRNGRQGLRRR